MGYKTLSTLDRDNSSIFEFFKKHFFFFNLGKNPVSATLMSSLANLEGAEAFETSQLGIADEVVQERISDDELILIKGPKARTSSSIILR